MQMLSQNEILLHNSVVRNNMSIGPVCREEWVQRSQSPNNMIFFFLVIASGCLLVCCAFSGYSQLLDLFHLSDITAFSRNISQYLLNILPIMKV